MFRDGPPSPPPKWDWGQKQTTLLCALKQLLSLGNPLSISGQGWGNAPKYRSNTGNLPGSRKSGSVLRCPHLPQWPPCLSFNLASGPFIFLCFSFSLNAVKIQILPTDRNKIHFHSWHRAPFSQGKISRGALCCSVPSPRPWTRVVLRSRVFSEALPAVAAPSQARRAPRAGSASIQARFWEGFLRSPQRGCALRRQGRQGAPQTAERRAGARRACGGSARTAQGPRKDRARAGRAPEAAAEPRDRSALSSRARGRAAAPRGSLRKRGPSSAPEGRRGLRGRSRASKIVWRQQRRAQTARLCAGVCAEHSAKRGKIKKRGEKQKKKKKKRSGQSRFVKESGKL